ncbi:MAG: SurA N-terminal domain-containing protein, partial [Chloroflexota bacterium]
MKDMIFRDKRLWIGLLVVSILISSWGLTGCNGQNISRISPSPTEPGPTASPEIPTATSEPLAALVNGMGIPLAFYEGEVARYKQAIESLGESLPSDAEVQIIVLNDLVDQTLLAQAAHEAGFEVSDELLAQKISGLAVEMGGEEILAIWQTEQGYDPAAFEAAMRLAIAGAWQRDQIIASIPDALEQVHAQQIFAYTSKGAQSALTSLNSGTDFNDLAWTYDPITGGELGWFPRGYLNVPA